MMKFGLHEIPVRAQSIVLPASVRKLIHWLLAIILLAFLGTGCSRFSPSYQPMIEVDLSTRSYGEETLAEIIVEETTVVTINFTMQNLNTKFLDLSLVGSDDHKLTILQSENYRTDRDGGGSWQQRLQSDTYRLMLSADQGPGLLAASWTVK